MKFESLINRTLTLHGQVAVYHRIPLLLIDKSVVHRFFSSRQDSVWQPIFPSGVDCTALTARFLVCGTGARFAWSCKDFLLAFTLKLYIYITEIRHI